MTAEPSGAWARRLLRAADRAALATRLPEAPPVAPEGGPGWPYASLALLAADHDAAPLLLLSDLAEHARNIAADPRVALLIDGTGGWADPLAGPRLTLLGRAAKDDCPRRRGRFLARHPAAEAYAGFADFHLYRVAVSGAHMVAGFGRIAWIAAADLAFGCRDAEPLAAGEPAILARMNGEHAAAVDRMANRLLGRTGTGWRMTGIDPEGCDLRRAGLVARLDFAGAVWDAEGAEAALLRLAMSP